MNLRVDFTLPDEQRSASLLNAKSLTRVGMLIAPLLVVLFIGHTLLGMFLLKRQAQTYQSQWESADGVRKSAMQMRAAVLKNEGILAELRGWKSSTLPWNEWVRGLLDVAPEDVHFTALQLTHSIASTADKKLARVWTMQLEGHAQGHDSRGNVEGIKDKLAGGSMSNMFDSVSVTRYAADTSVGSSRSDRIFQITAKFVPREF